MKKEIRKFYEEQLQFVLKNAFYWMARATQESKDGIYQMSVGHILRAVNYWTEAQHIKDTYLGTDCDVDYETLTNNALMEAKKEINQEKKGK